MHRNSLLTELEHYGLTEYITKEELTVLPRFIKFIHENPDCFARTNSGHITGSTWIVNHNYSHALLTHHKKLNLWLQLGGHAGGDTDIKAVALKEAEEESGITDFKFLMPIIFDIDIHPIPGPCTYHYDIRFLLQAPTGASYQVSEESHDLRWIAHTKIDSYSKERSVLRMAEKIVALPAI